MAVYSADVEHFPTYVLRYIRALRDAGFFVAVIAPTDQPSPRPDMVGNRIGCDLYLERRNIGLDFGSWGDFSRWLSYSGTELKHFDKVLLINDSLVGPLGPLDDLFSKLASSEAEIQGLTDSYQGAHHLQSYFLLFQGKALLDGFLDRWLSQAPYYTNKRFLIEVMEMGLITAASASGLRWRVLFPALDLAPRDLSDKDREDILRSHGSTWLFSPQNPTHLYAGVLLSRGYPFIKRDLLMKNPLGLEFVSKLSRRSDVQHLMGRE